MGNLLKTVFSILAVVSLLSSNTAFAQAVTDDDLKSVYRETPLYSETDASACTPGGSGVSLSGPGLAKLDTYTLPANKGTTGREEAINAQGQVKSSWGKSGGTVTFHSLLSKIPADKQQAYMDYYITMRWNYIRWNWNGTASGPVDEKQMSWMGSKPRLVLVTNPKSGKSIVAAALESGPAPWVGVDSSSNNTPKQGWVNPQLGTPSTYKGIVSGFPPVAYKALGLGAGDAGYPSENGVELLYSWAPDQNITPGPVNLTQTAADTGPTSSATTTSCSPQTDSTTPTNGQYIYYTQDSGPYANIDIPGSNTISSSGCGIVSYAMAVANLKKDSSINPRTITDWMSKQNLSYPGGSRGIWLVQKGASTFGVSGEVLSGRSEILAALRAGKFVITSGQISSNDPASSPYTSGGHIVLLTNENSDGTIHVLNPLKNWGKDRSYTIDQIMNGQTYAISVHN